jgi:hypothetical protein
MLTVMIHLGRLFYVRPNNASWANHTIQCSWCPVSQPTYTNTSTHWSIQALDLSHLLNHHLGNPSLTLRGFVRYISTVVLYILPLSLFRVLILA